MGVPGKTVTGVVVILVTAAGLLASEWLKRVKGQTEHEDRQRLFEEEEKARLALIDAERQAKEDLKEAGLELRAAAEAGDATKLRSVVEKWKERREHALIKGWTDLGPSLVQCNPALYLACQNGHGECVSILCELAELDVNYVHRDSLHTPLYIAALNGRKDCLEVLVVHPRIDLKPEVPWPVAVAKDAGREECVAVLAKAMNMSLEEVTGVDSERQLSAKNKAILSNWS